MSRHPDQCFMLALSIGSGDYREITAKRLHLTIQSSLAIERLQPSLLPNVAGPTKASIWWRYRLVLAHHTLCWDYIEEAENTCLARADFEYYFSHLEFGVVKSIIIENLDHANIFDECRFIYSRSASACQRPAMYPLFILKADFIISAVISLGLALAFEEKQMHWWLQARYGGILLSTPSILLLSKYQCKPHQTRPLSYQNVFIIKEARHA